MRCSAAYTVAFSIRDTLHYEGVSGCFTSFNLDRLELYSNHISQNKSHSRMKMRERSECGGCARDLHARSLTFPMGENTGALAMGATKGWGGGGSLLPHEETFS